MGTLVGETKKVDMEMPEEKEKKEKKEKKKQTNSVSSKPQKRISPELSEGDTIQQKEGESFRLEPISFSIPRRARHPSPEPSGEDLLQFEEDLREFIALRAARKKVQPNVVQTVRRPSESLWETDSTDSSVSMKSASSMYEPPNFNLQRKQSCSVCEEAVKDPVLLPCGHWSCKECSHSVWDEYGDSDPCKKCGRRSEREKRDQDLRSVLLEKTIKRVEMETEKFQAEKETFELEKRKLALEMQLLEQKGKYTNYDQGVVIPKTRIPYI